MARFFSRWPFFLKVDLFVQPRVVVITPPPPPVKFIVLLPPPPGKVNLWNVLTALSGTAVAIFSGFGLTHQRKLLVLENCRNRRERRSAEREEEEAERKVLREKREVEAAGREVNREKREEEAHQILVQREKNRWWK
ncbi:hypothetical protein RchiOBHm_Chr4g0385811 [Rosa chinensis]|uniref:Uncharacterized protein n=1 Tax=Rosa chinensis TaxID=74649 RepID=A0A2P6QP53_ROSCH|nr:hypothetical protein RchiOBHm_Chr4g0385811 [Rosa chinensis]